MNCPWDSWRQSDLHFCEAALCGWVKQPGNTYSNIFLLLVAVVIWWGWNKTHRQMAKELTTILVILFFGSSFLHASMTFYGEVADFAGMFFYIARLMVWNSERLLNRPLRHAEGWYWFIAGLPVALMFFGFRGVPLFQSGIVLVLSGEAILYLRGDRRAPYRYLAFIALTMSVAYKFWWLDVDEKWCDTNSHVFSGHIVWHLLTSLTFILTAKFYETFRREHLT